MEDSDIEIFVNTHYHYINEGTDDSSSTSSLEKEAELFVNTYFSYLDEGGSQDEESTTEEENIEANTTTTETNIIISEANTEEEASMKRMIQVYQDEYNNEGNVYLGDVFYKF